MAETIVHALQSCALPLLEARMLMQHVTGYSRVQLLTHDTEVLNDAQQVHWQTLIARRVQGEPMAYIIGEREFYGRMFAVNPNVLIPRPDTETLIDAVLSDFGAQALSAIDLGTGSGAIALTLAAERPSWNVCATDISAQALEVARQNSQRLNTSVRFFEGDWWAALPADESLKFHIVVSNPPYIEANDEHLSEGDVRFEPIGALTDGADGLQHYRRILYDVARYLHTNGAVYFEHGYNQGASVRGILSEANFTQVRTIQDLSGNDRVSTGILK
ncbi:MAG: prmC [Burkholderiaceae bacterium]|nr:prmC [Burkholderiaceae bacterium]